MIYKCNNCGGEIGYLETDGDEINENFICPECAEMIEEALQEERRINNILTKVLAKTP